MKIKEVKKFQEGGQMPAGDPAAQGDPNAQAQDPMTQLLQQAMQVVQTQDCGLGIQVCEALISMAQQSQGGGQAAPQGEPVYKKGGGIKRRI